MNKQARTHKELALDQIYAEIPAIPNCDGSCAEACGPIAMFKAEWERVKRSAGRTPKLRPGALTCPMLSPTGRCTVYTVRPYICRLWGTTPALRCPRRECEPERWLSTAQARDIYLRLRAVAGPQIDGPLRNVKELWEGFALEAREERQRIIEHFERKATQDAQ